MLVTGLLSLLLVGWSTAEWTLDLEYSFDDFAHSYPLGSIELRRVFDGNYTGAFTSKADSNLFARLKENWKKVYRVRSKSSAQPGKYLTTYTQPCLLLQSNLFHLFWVAIDNDQQAVHSITVFPDSVAAGGKLDSSNCDVSQFTSEKSAAKGTVHVLNKGALPTPETQAFVQRIENERKSRQHGAETDNRSFLAKYWMYIVPVVLFMVVSNAVNPEQGASE